MRRKQFGIRNSELGNDAGAREKRLSSSAFRIPRSAFALVIALVGAASPLASAQDTSAGDKMLAEYFRAETAKLAERCLADIKTLEDWTSKRDEYRRQLAEMLGLDPMPERTDLRAVVTGKLENEFFTVEKVQFQSRPGLYVTGDLYLPKNADKPAPAVLYVCGHGQVKKNGVSLGNKTAYQHHGGWLARNGFVCLTIDTIQLGEIEGLHHGTYREGMWWWNSRGYTPAGVEAWNGIRALDYLQSRPEVDGEKLGVAGRSGGGAYSWWIAALDERVKAAVPTAGITDLENHVVDGVVEGHCDCMFMVNTYRWDYPQVAALVAPRALLLTNTDKDSIFPLDGVVRVHRKMRDIYRLYDAEKQLGLQISEGPHKDIQELQVAEFHWFNRFLKGEDAPVENTGIKYFEPEELKVFESLPADEITSRVHESFVLAAEPPKVPENQDDWARQRDAWMKSLKEKCFAGWPEEPSPLNVEELFSVERNGNSLTVYEFDSQPHVRLRVVVRREAAADPAHWLHVSLGVEGPSSQAAAARIKRDFPEEFAKLGLTLDAESAETVAAAPGVADVVFYPRGLGASQWDSTPRKQIQIRRRFMLLGQTLFGMQVWDVRRALQSLRSQVAYQEAKISLHGQGELGAAALYASLFEPSIWGLAIYEPPHSHQRGPDLLNVLRFLDLPQAAAMAGERLISLSILQHGLGGWEFTQAAIEVASRRQKRLNVVDLDAQKASQNTNGPEEFQVVENEQEIRLVTPDLAAAIRKQGYVSGVAAGSLLDKKTGFCDAGFGLDIVDWIMEPGSDKEYRDRLPKEMIYEFGNLYHGNTPKRSIEGPQICMQAKQLSPRVIRGQDFVAIEQEYRYTTAAPGKKTGSRWSQRIVFPAGKRYFISSDRIDAVNDSPAMFLRLDLPGHIKHDHGDTFSEVYLSYVGKIPASEFDENFAPDAKFNYRRDDAKIPSRMIRAYHLRDPKTGKAGPWLAGMTLNAADVSEAWCHQRGYVCMIEEFGGRPIRAGESFSAAFIVGYFDSIEEMEQVYDRYAGHSGLEASAEGWKLTK